MDLPLIPSTAPNVVVAMETGRDVTTYTVATPGNVTSYAGDDVTHSTSLQIVPTSKTKDGDDGGIDVTLLVALVLFGIGVILLIAGFIKVIMWYRDTRRHRRYSKRWIRHLEHKRHLDEYAIRTGDSGSMRDVQLGDWSGYLHDVLADNQSTTSSRSRLDNAAADTPMGSRDDVSVSQSRGVANGHAHRGDFSANNEQTTLELRHETVTTNQGPDNNRQPIPTVARTIPAHTMATNMASSRDNEGRDINYNDLYL